MMADCCKQEEGLGEEGISKFEKRSRAAAHMSLAKAS